MPLNSNRVDDPGNDLEKNSRIANSDRRVASSDRPGPSFSFRLITSCLLAFSMLMVSGCSGCKSKPRTAAEKKKEEEEKKKNKPKEDFEFHSPVAMPAVFPDFSEDEEIDPEETEKQKLQRIERKKEAARNFNRVKPGHWVTTYFQIVANNFDGRGELTCTSVDAAGNGVPVENTRYVVSSSRPASLPKGQWRNLETSVYHPCRSNMVTAKVRYDLRSPNGLTLTRVRQPTSVMDSHQFHFVVLSHRPDAYKYINLLSVIKVEDPNSLNTEFPMFYYVIPSRDKDPVPLPRHALNWTTMAYVLWDDYASDEIDTEQQVAMLDWIHHGGQLIISGPDSLDKLQTGFLADYLPAEYKAAAEFGQEDFVEFNKNWSIGSGDDSQLTVMEDKPVLGITFDVHPDAEEVSGTGGLAVERRIGRGRIVMTAFSLDDKKMVYWPGFDSFMNGALMRRPGRVFGESTDSFLTHRWMDDDASIFDPLVGSSVRFMSRDFASAGTPEAVEFSKELIDDGMSFYGNAPYDTSKHRMYAMNENSSMRREAGDVWRYGGFSDTLQSGVGGWNDNNGIADSARTTLKQAAGISPPPADFVFKMLAGYLLVLVPLNWLIFRAIGKVEWAWVAAPLIAIAGTITVIKMASLDIGFVRSNTQISLLEIHGDYDRAHMTSYSALYTSLSTSYNVELENQTAQSLPFPRQPGDQSIMNSPVSTVTLDRSRENRMEGFQIRSNSTGMLHTEAMIDIGGAFSAVGDDETGWSVLNSSGIEIRDAGIVYRTLEDELKIAWIGDLAAGAQSDVLNLETTARRLVPEQWRKSPRFVSDEQIVSGIWADLGSAEYVPLMQLKTHQQIAEHWPAMLAVGLRENILDSDNFQDQEINYEEFLQLYVRSNPREGVNIGAMFDTVIENIGFEPGEMKLIAAAEGQIGQPKFDPESTQTIQQTLVVVHLKSGEMPVAKRDKNTKASAISRMRNFEDDLNTPFGG